MRTSERTRDLHRRCATQKPTLALSSVQGRPGIEVTATAAGFGDCHPVSFQWDGTPLQGSTTDGPTFTFTVPNDAPANTHTVTASCGQANAPATFTVDAPPQKPTLALSSVQGQPGIEVTATAAGFGDCHPVSFQWDGTPLQGSTTDGPTFTFTVPNDAPANTHTVTASCGQANAPATFTVDAPPQKPTLALRPGHGTPGSQVTASGAGFACGNDRVQLRWDDDPPLTDAPSGTFEVPLTVPAGVGGHSVTASCRDISERQPFTVTTEPTPVSGPPTVLTLQPTSGLARGHGAGHRRPILLREQERRTVLGRQHVAAQCTPGRVRPFLRVGAGTAHRCSGPHHVASCLLGPTGAIGRRLHPARRPATATATKKSVVAIVLTLGIAVLAVLAVRHWQKSKRGKPPTHTVRTVPVPTTSRKPR